MSTTQNSTDQASAVAATAPSTIPFPSPGTAELTHRAGRWIDHWDPEDMQQ